MRLFQAATVVQLLAVRLVTASPFETADAPAIAIDPATEPLKGLAQLQQHAYETLENREKATRRAPKGCSLANTAVRRDW